MKLKDKYWEVIKHNIGYRQTLWEWQLSALKAKKPIEKIERLIECSQESENLIVLLFAKLERMEMLNHDKSKQIMELSEKVIELEKEINRGKQIEEL